MNWKFMILLVGLYLMGCNTTPFTKETLKHSLPNHETWSDNSPKAIENCVKRNSNFIFETWESPGTVHMTRYWHDTARWEIRMMEAKGRLLVQFVTPHRVVLTNENEDIDFWPVIERCARTPIP